MRGAEWVKESLSFESRATVFNTASTEEILCDCDPATVLSQGSGSIGVKMNDNAILGVTFIFQVQGNTECTNDLYKIILGVSMRHC